MDLNDIKTFFETNKDKEEVKTYLMELSRVTSEGVENFIKSDEGKKWLGKQNDSFFSKSLESWKKNNLDELVNKLYKDKHPDADPKDLELKKLQDEVEKMKRETTRKELVNKALKIATEKKLPTDLIDYFIGDDEEKTTANLQTLESVVSSHVENLVKERLKNDYVPPKGSDKGTEEIDKFKNAIGL